MIADRAQFILSGFGNEIAPELETQLEVMRPKGYTASNCAVRGQERCRF